MRQFVIKEIDANTNQIDVDAMKIQVVAHLSAVNKMAMVEYAVDLCEKIHPANPFVAFDYAFKAALINMYANVESEEEVDIESVIDDVSLMESIYDLIDDDISQLRADCKSALEYASRPKETAFSEFLDTVIELLDGVSESVKGVDAGALSELTSKISELDIPALVKGMKNMDSED